jgi:hypothetical protein
MKGVINSLGMEVLSITMLACDYEIVLFVENLASEKDGMKIVS